MNIKEAYTFDEFKKFALDEEKQFSFDTLECPDPVHRYLRDEREFWSIVHGNIGTLFL